MELLSFLLTGGEVFDSKVAIDLLKTVDLTDKTVLADRAYGASDIRDHICKNAALSCIPDKVNSQIKHSFDKEVYKQRNIVERFFNKIKNNRHIAMRFDKLSIFLEFYSSCCLQNQVKMSLPTDPSKFIKLT